MSRSGRLRSGQRQSRDLPAASLITHCNHSALGVNWHRDGSISLDTARAGTGMEQPNSRAGISALHSPQAEPPCKQRAGLGSFLSLALFFLQNSSSDPPRSFPRAQGQGHPCGRREPGECLAAASTARSIPG